MKALQTSVTLAVGALLASAAAPAAQANPFGFSELPSGYQQAAQQQQEMRCGGKDKANKKADKEMKCGEGKCGEAYQEKRAKHQAEGKCGEGKCGEAMSEKMREKMREKMDAKKKGKAEQEMKCGEGKCGEGKCGEQR